MAGGGGGSAGETWTVVRKGVAIRANRAIRQRICDPCVLLKTSPFSSARNYARESAQNKAIELRGGAWSRFHALEPGSEVLVGRVERLADTLREVEEGEQQDIGHGELVAGK